MKLKYLFASLLAAFTLVGCTEEIQTSLENLKVSKSYVAIAAEGGSDEITVTANDSWWFEIDEETAKWLTVTPESGDAGQDIKITFTAGAATDTNESVIYLNCGDKDGKYEQQNINVLQLTEKGEPRVYTISEVLAFTDDMKGQTIRVKGSISRISNPTYGELYITDDSGKELLIYNCQPSYDEVKPAVGDIVTFEGPFTIYNGTYELNKGTTIVDIERSLLKVESVSYGEAAEGEEAPTEIALEGGSAVVVLTSKTGGVNVEIADDAKSWLSVGGMNVDGTTVTVTFNAAANNLGDRKTTVTFTTEADGKTYTSIAEIAQKGAILEKTAAEINAAADGETIYRLTGYISGDKGSEYGNIYIKDYTGEVYVYGVLDAEGQSKQWFNMGIKAGDIVTVEGVKTSYKDAPQMKNVQVTKHITVTPLSVADFTAKEDNKEVYYQLTGTVKNIVMDKNDPTQQNVYGNFDLVDETGSIYVYGLTQGWGGPSKMFREMNIKEGDKLTIVGVHASYGGAAQVGSAFLAAHEAAGEGGEETPDQPEEPKGIVYELGANAYDDGLATVNGTEGIKTIKIGTSSKAGTFTLTIPAGTKKVSFNAVAWKGLSGVTVDITPEGGSTVSLPINANDGATGQAPYTITATDADKYSFDTNNAADLKVTVTSAKRVIFWGITAE